MILERIKYVRVLSLFLVFWMMCFSDLTKEVEATDFDLRVRTVAFKCRDEVTEELQKLLETNRLNLGQIFDTFYIPIANSSPQKYSTQYDKISDEVLRIILDKYLMIDKRLLFVVAIDRNGYVPTHNSKYSKPLTSDPDYNAKFNRTKRLFNDRTGLAAARNTKPFLLQTYSRDTGESMYDLSVPIFIRGKHWAAIRIAYSK